MTLTIPAINLIPVIVTGIAIFFLGGLWYMALFGKLWQKYNGYTEEHVKAMQKARPPHIFFGTMLISYWLLATLLSFVIDWTKASTWMDGALVGLVIWGMVQCIAITSYISGTTRKEVYFIDGAYQFCYLILAGIMLTIWR